MKLLTRLGKFSQTYTLTEQTRTTTLIQMGQKKVIVNADIERMDQAWYDWSVKGQSIQLAFYFLPPDAREFILTGLTPTEWNALMSEEEE